MNDEHARAPALRIGVTGHRILAGGTELAKVVKAIDGALAMLIIAYPRRTLTVLSALADGADRLVADRVLLRASSQLTAILPFAPEEYRKDFATPESLAEFERLLAQATEQVICSGEDRNSCYLAAGERVVAGCDVLIAIWDGLAPQGKGGTSAIVQLARQQQLPLIWIHAGNRRPGTNEPTALPKHQGKVTFERLPPLGLQPIPWGDSAPENPSDQRRLEQINHQHVNYPAILSCWKGFHRFDEPLSAGSRSPTLDRCRRAVEAHFLPWYTRASEMARISKRKHQISGLAIWTLAPCSIAAVTYGLLWPAASSFFYPLELFLLVALLVIIYWANRQAHHETWIESRLLTELLRSAIYLSSCGIMPRRVASPAHIGPVAPDQNWISRVSQEVINRFVSPPECAENRSRDCSICASFIQRSYVHEQLEYHKQAAPKNEHRAHRCERLSWCMFLLALLAAFGHVLCLWVHAAHGHHAIHDILTAAAIIFPAVGAAISGFRGHREYDRLAQSSRSMAAELRSIEQQLDNVPSHGHFEELARSIESVMIGEVYHWLNLMSFKHPEPP